MYTISDVFKAWALGMFTTIPLFVMVFWVLPWLSGWRHITYNIHWDDTNKRYWIWRQVKWMTREPQKATSQEPKEER